MGIYKNMLIDQEKETLIMHDGNISITASNVDYNEDMRKINICDFIGQTLLTLMIVPRVDAEKIYQQVRQNYYNCEMSKDDILKGW